MTETREIRNIPDETWRKAKSQAALEGKTLAQWLRDLIEKAVSH